MSAQEEIDNQLSKEENQVVDQQFDSHKTSIGYSINNPEGELDAINNHNAHQYIPGNAAGIQPLGYNTNGPSFSRASSAGSINVISCSSASSTHNTDEDDDSDSAAAMQTTCSYKDRRRREAHTQAEQKRRDAIKMGYDELLNIVPTCSDLLNQKLSKASILQKSIDYIQFLMQQKKKQEEELDLMQKEVIALKIMKQNYEQIVKTHEKSPLLENNQVSDEFKFNLFEQLMDELFKSFEQSVEANSFSQLSNCVFQWLEENCKPSSLKQMCMDIMKLNEDTTNLKAEGY